MAEYKDELLDHDFDGIQELDNNLPRWWLGLFYFSIIWGVLYMLYFHVFDIGYLQEDEYRSEINPNYVRVQEGGDKILGVLPEYHSPLHNPRGDLTPYKREYGAGGPAEVTIMTAETDTTTYVAVTDETRLVNGEEAFQKNCMQCHGKFGEGGVGPNLTDNYWLHPSDMTGVVKSIKYGYPSKGMIAWRGILQPEEIIDVASFVLTLKGTDPPNPKAPQGELVTE